MTMNRNGKVVVAAIVSLSVVGLFLLAPVIYIPAAIAPGCGFCLNGPHAHYDSVGMFYLRCGGYYYPSFPPMKAYYFAC